MAILQKGVAQWFVGFLVFGTVNCFACPLCHTGTGQQVRAGIFGPDFLSNLFAVLSPFSVLAIIVSLIYYGRPLFPRRAEAGSEHTPSKQEPASEIGKELRTHDTS